MLAVAGVALLLTSTDSGHASVSGAVAFLADGVHITAAAVWLGGLAFVLGAIAVSPPEKRWQLAAVSVPRFSLMAMISVPLLGAAGIVSAYLEVRAWRGLWETTYGVLILAKVGLVLPLLALGAFNNRVSVPALRTAAASKSTRTRFIRAVAAELGLLVVVLGVTAALVDEAPAKDLLKSSSSAPVGLHGDGRRVLSRRWSRSGRYGGYQHGADDCHQRISSPPDRRGGPRGGAARDRGQAVN